MSVPLLFACVLCVALLYYLLTPCVSPCYSNTTVQWFNRLIELVYPPSCLSCQSRLPEPSSLELCAGCERRLRAVPPPRCPRCARHSAIHLQPGETCVACRQLLPSFRSALAAFEYASVLRDCIHRIKFESHQRLASALGERLARIAGAHLRAAQYDAVIPVPLHRARWRDRGFNQSEALATPVSCALDVPLESAALRRTRGTQPQSRLEPPDRHDNVDGAFQVREPQRIAGRRLLLVDDVLTTGATADACSRALLDAGAASVDVLVLATN